MIRRAARTALSALSVICLLLAMSADSYHQESDGPITKEALLRSLKKGLLHKDDLGFLIGELQKRGVTFQLTNEDEQEFRDAVGSLIRRNLIT